jgi:hypothetical protein
MKSSLSISQEEVLLDMIDDRADDGITMDALFSTPSAPVVSVLKEEMVEEKNQEVVFFSLQDKRVLCSPTSNEYSEEESIGYQSSYESESSCQEQHNRKKDPSTDIHEEISFSQLADVIGADKGEMEEINVQLISCIEPVNEKISPGINQPASLLYPPIHSMDIEQQLSNDEVQEVFSDQLSFPDYKCFDPVELYLEMCFPQVLDPAK